MSAVVDAVSDVFDAVGDVVETVGDVVGDVVETVGDVIETVVENPEIAIIAFAAPQLLPAIGITGAAVAPVTAGLISASQGGDLEDIGKAALTAYVAPQVAGRVGSVVAEATQGSSLQNVLSSTVGSAAGGATAAAITGGDVGKSAILGAVGGAGGAIARDVATAGQYGTTPFSEQTAGLISQDYGVNPLTELAAGAGSATGRVLAGADAGREFAGVAQSAIQREIENLVSQAVASSKSPESEPTKSLIVSEIQNNPAFREQLQIAQIAFGNQPLTIDEQADVLAETYAREIFADAAAMSAEDVAALPALVPIAGIAARSAAAAAVRAAPQMTQQIARFAANDPRFAAVVASNPYVQSLLAAAGVTISVTMSGDTIVNPVQTPDQSPAETARLARQAIEIQKIVPNANQQQIQNLENVARRADYEQMVDDLQEMQDRGYNVTRELNKAQEDLSNLPEITPLEPFQIPEIEPTTMPEISPAPSVPRPYTPTFPEEPVRTPTRTPSPGRTPAPEMPPETAPEIEPGRRVEPGISPTPGEEIAPDTALRPSTRPGTRPAEEPAPQPQPRTQPARRTQPTRPTGTRPPGFRPPVDNLPPRTGGKEGVGSEDTVTEEPINIEDLISDQEILNLISPSTGTFTPVTDLTARVARTSAERPSPMSLSPRVTGEALSGLLKPKEPLFGGDEDAQRAIWNRRSLRLRRALGL